MLGLDVLVLVEEIPQLAGAVGEVLGCLVEQREETLVGRNEAEAHADTPERNVHATFR